MNSTKLLCVCFFFALLKIGSEPAYVCMLCGQQDTRWIIAQNVFRPLAHRSVSLSLLLRSLSSTRGCLVFSMSFFCCYIPFPFWIDVFLCAHIGQVFCFFVCFWSLTICESINRQTKDYSHSLIATIFPLETGKWTSESFSFNFVVDGCFRLVVALVRLHWPQQQNQTTDPLTFSPFFIQIRCRSNEKNCYNKQRNYNNNDDKNEPLQFGYISSISIQTVCGLFFTWLTASIFCRIKWTKWFVSLKQRHFINQLCYGYSWPHHTFAKDPFCMVIYGVLERRWPLQRQQSNLKIKSKATTSTTMLILDCTIQSNCAVIDVTLVVFFSSLLLFSSSLACNSLFVALLWLCFCCSLIFSTSPLPTLR